MTKRNIVETVAHCFKAFNPFLLKSLAFCGAKIYFSYFIP